MPIRLLHHRSYLECGLEILLIATLACVAAVAMAYNLAAGGSTSHLQGGQTTHPLEVYGQIENAFSLPAANLSFAQRSDFAIGNAMFRRVWVSSPASTKSTDGLGPIFNARSCQRCHIKDGRGHPPTANFPDDNAVSMLMRLSVHSSSEERTSAQINARPHPVLGGQLQDFSVQGVPSEGKISITYEEQQYLFPDGQKSSLQKPVYAIERLQYQLSPIDQQNILLSPRVAPPMIGLGLLEAIPWKRIESLADPGDRNHDGISGRIAMVWTGKENEHKTLKKGRFGWKATEPSLRSQIRGAFLGDMGLSTGSSAKHWGDCTKQQTRCRKAIHGSKDRQPEVQPKVEDLVLFYSQHLSVPPRRNSNTKEVVNGKKLFGRIGCTSCHVPSHQTDANWPDPALRDQKIFPYTDLLVHDMGPELSDNRPVANLAGSEWRTPPLWGIGYTKDVSKHTRFLHDGRARNLEEAILWHGGEGSRSKLAYTKLSKAQRSHVLSFLGSL